MKMNEEIDLNICDVLCSWNKLSSNDNSRKLVKVNVEDFPSGELENNSVLSEKIAEDISAGERKPLNNKAKTFTCSTCYKNLSSRNSLRIHLKIHSGDKNYCCEHCGKLFAHNATLIGHLTKFHNINVDTAHTCTLCNKIFCRKNALKIHMAIHVGFKPFSCSICSKSFSQKITRDIHALTHTGKYDYSCSDCPRKFSTLYKLNYHKKSHNLHEDYHLKNDSLSVCNQESENLPEYHCLLCLEQFTNKDDLDRHCDSHSSNLEKVNDEEHYKNSSFQSVKLTDPLGCIESGITDKNEKQVDGSGTLSLNNEVSASKKKFTCNFCGFIFPERRSLLHHIKMRHAVIPSVRHNCFICHKSFSQKSKLNFHMKRHTELPNFRCEICGKRYYRKDSLEKHRNIHIKTNTTCIICEKKCKTENELKKHMILHTSLDYTCLQCGKTFTTKTAHKYHSEMHKGNFQFICNYCGKKFVRKCHYEEHVKTHSLIRPFKCLICNKAFGENKLLNRHLQRCHSAEKNAKLTEKNENPALMCDFNSEKL